MNEWMNEWSIIKRQPSTKSDGWTKVSGRMWHRTVEDNQWWPCLPNSGTALDYRSVTRCRNFGVGIGTRRRGFSGDRCHNYDIFNVGARSTAPPTLSRQHTHISASRRLHALITPLALSVDIFRFILHTCRQLCLRNYATVGLVVDTLYVRTHSFYLPGITVPRV